MAFAIPTVSDFINEVWGYYNDQEKAGYVEQENASLRHVMCPFEEPPASARSYHDLLLYCDTYCVFCDRLLQSSREGCPDALGVSGCTDMTCTITRLLSRVAALEAGSTKKERENKFVRRWKILYGEVRRIAVAEWSGANFVTNPGMHLAASGTFPGVGSTSFYGSASQNPIIKHIMIPKESPNGDLQEKQRKILSKMWE